jgi:hypothetical protein
MNLNDLVKFDIQDLIELGFANTIPIDKNKKHHAQVHQKRIRAFRII